MSRVAIATVLAFLPASLVPQADKPPSSEEARQALKKAVRFFHTRVARHGGYLWQYSGDLALREAEGRVTGSFVWVQPPGTPTVGEAFLDAYEATGDKEYLDAARRAGDVLVKGQMRTGGWGYSVECDADKRKEYAYRDVPEVRTTRWKRATVLDDDTTSGAVRFLARLDKALAFKEKSVHDAVEYALDRLLTSQYPNGSWFGWWEYEPKGFSPKDYPVKPVSYPEKWSRTPAEGAARWPAKYVINDDLVSDMIRTLLDCGDLYQEKRYRDAARKAGDFLLLAQLPDPQPAWAQQYDLDMHPCWARKFEPPAVSGAESQTVLETLLILYRRTGDKKYLEPVPRALVYLKKSLLPDGRLARFYELKSNKPLYFTKQYELTYESNDLPEHYGFLWESRLKGIEGEYNKLKDARPEGLAKAEKPDRQALRAKARAAIDSLDERGAWVEKGRLRFHRIEPASGVINCQTFADNVRTLCMFLKEET